MDIKNYFCKTYSNPKQIRNIINQAFLTEIHFKGQIVRTGQILPPLSLTNVTDYLFFTCDYSPDIKISSSKTDLQLTFYIQMTNSALPCEFTVQAMPFTKKGDKLMILTLFPTSLALLQRREQTRYKIKKENYFFYELAFTNTPVIQENWKSINNNNIIYNDISRGGIYIQLKNINRYEIPTLKSVLILKCRFPALPTATPIDRILKKTYSNFIIVARIRNIKKKGNILHIRAKFTHWSYSLTQKRWNTVFPKEGITPLESYISIK